MMESGFGAVRSLSGAVPSGLSCCDSHGHDIGNAVTLVRLTDHRTLSRCGPRFSRQGLPADQAVARD